VIGVTPEPLDATVACSSTGAAAGRLFGDSGSVLYDPDAVSQKTCLPRV
jgi:hypothetical protein